MRGLTGARLTGSGAVTAALLAVAAWHPGAAAAAGCENVTLRPDSSNLTHVRLATVCLLNQERARLGRRPLRMHADLLRAAQHHAADMAARRYFSHVTLGGPSTVPRLRASGYVRRGDRYEFGEALGFDYGERAVPARIMETRILGSARHRAKLLASRFQHVGVGIVPAPPFPRPGYTGATYTIDVALRIR